MNTPNTTTELSRFFKSHEFKKSILMTSVMILVGFIAFSLGQKAYITGLCIGVLLTSFCDLQGSFRHRTYAMLLSLMVNCMNIFLISFISTHLVFLTLYVGLMVFLISVLSVYGNRASYFTFSCLLGLILSMIRRPVDVDITYYILAISLGGIIYLLASSLYHSLTRKHQVNQQLGELIKLIVDYLELRIEIAHGEDSEQYTQTILLEKQVEITDKQEILRSLILSKRLERGGHSSSRKRQFLILVELIDIMELAVANPTKFPKVKETLGNDFRFLQPFIECLSSITSDLQKTSHVLLDHEELKNKSRSKYYLELANASISDYVAVIKLPKARPGALMMRSLHSYLEELIRQVDSIDRLLSNVTRQRKLTIKQKKIHRFITKEDYSLEILLQNFSFQSSSFRHAVRISIAMMLGLSLGHFVQVKNPYWILLTILVILRPSYGLTKERSLKRVIGTIIGAVVAIGIVLITQNFYVYLALAILTLVLANSLLTKNYIYPAIFFTLNVIFVFSLLQPDHWTVIQYRIIDTLIGAGLAYLFGYFVFPIWEYKTIKDSLKQVIQSNSSYLKNIVLNYDSLEESLEFKLSRKQAFIESSNLNASFQRMTQDPKSKRKNVEMYYELVTLNQAMLSAIASLGSFIRQHRIKEVKQSFQVIVNDIIDQLSQIENSIANNHSVEKIEASIDSEKAKDNLNHYWDELEKQRNRQILRGQTEIETSFLHQLQEVRLIQEELNWLQELTKNIRDTTVKI